MATYYCMAKGFCVQEAKNQKFFASGSKRSKREAFETSEQLILFKTLEEAKKARFLRLPNGINQKSTKEEIEAAGIEKDFAIYKIELDLDKEQIYFKQGEDYSYEPINKCKFDDEFNTIISSGYEIPWWVNRNFLYQQVPPISFFEIEKVADRVEYKRMVEFNVKYLNEPAFIILKLIKYSIPITLKAIIHTSLIEDNATSCAIL